MGTIDGGHLKGEHAGVMTTVGSLDANNQVFTYALMLSPGETKASYDFILNRLPYVLGEDMEFS